KQASQSASKLTPPPRTKPSDTGGSTAVTLVAATAPEDTTPESVWADITDRMEPAPARPATPPPLPAVARRRPRWPFAVGGVAAVALLTAGAVALWPRTVATTDPAAGRDPNLSLTAATPHTPVKPPDLPDEVRQFVGHQGPIEAVAFTPDGKRLVTVGQDKTGRVWEVATGKELKRLEGHNSSVRCVAVLPDGRRAVTASADKTIRLWDLDTGKELKKFAGHTAGLWAVACDRDGRRLLTAGMDHVIRLWDVDGARTESKKLEGHTDRVYSVAFLPDGRRAVSAGGDKTMRLWDLDTCKELRKLDLPEKDRVGRLSLSADGKWVLLGCGKTLRRWDPDGPMRTTYLVTSGHVERAAALPDGRVLVSVSDGTVRLWDVDRDRELHSFPGHGQEAAAVAAAPDGRHFATGGKDGTARLWRIGDAKAP
ncbi:MAG TPA: WD40 repeat domain-containing protein, partial [Gemmataceae bacterium]